MINLKLKWLYYCISKIFNNNRPILLIVATLTLLERKIWLQLNTSWTECYRFGILQPLQMV
jgi:hypothetical protein